VTIDGWITIGIVLAMLLGLSLTRVAADLIMLAALATLLVTGVLDEKQALAGFANEGVITVGILFAVAAGLRETGGMAMVAQRVLGSPKSIAAAQLRMMAPTAVMSGFMNNTPLVAMMMPVVIDWAKRLRIPASKLLMPLSFATILGGICTLIGTSTNLVVHGLLLEHQRHVAAEQVKAGLTPDPVVGLGMFDLTLIGLPCMIAGLAYILIASRWLLPDRTPPVSTTADPREYTVEMTVEPGGALVGRTIEQAGLRQLPGLFLIEIERGGEVLPAVAPQVALQADDRLIFAGVVDAVVELQKIRGLRPATNQVYKLDSPRAVRCLIEVVVSNTCRIVGQSIREGRFRTIYNAAVIAAARNGVRIRKKIGDIVLQPGDTLLLEAHPSFFEQHRNSRDFYLANRLPESNPPRHNRAWLAIGILAAMVTVASFGWLSMMQAALLAGGLMVITRCVNASTARRNVDWQLLLVIGAALGVGKAMEVSGAAATIVGAFQSIGGSNPWVALAVIYLLTMVFTEIMTNNAAAALMFPIAVATANAMGVNEMPFVVSIAIAASCGFATPIGYQTNLMVYGPGGYRFTDYLRFGGLLNLVVAAVTITLAPIVFGF
jgi:di/tricarboxylate transporter